MDRRRLDRAGTLALVCCLQFLSACAPAPAADTPAPVPAAATASLTVLPRFTLVPTGTALPATPIPLPTPLAGRLVHAEHFDSQSTLGFKVDAAGDMQIQDGRMILTVPTSGNASPGHVAERSTFSPHTGDVSIFLFRVEKNTRFGFHYELYENTDSGVYYRGINLDCTPGVSLDIDSGYGSDHPTRIALPVSRFQAETWYYYALQVHPDGSVTAQIWERDEPRRVIFERSFPLDPGWTKPGFTFIVAVSQGRMEVDEYQEVEPVNGP